MGKKDKEKFGKYGVSKRAQVESTQAQFNGKKRFSTGTKTFLALTLVAIVVVSLSYAALSQSQPQSNPSQTNNPSQTAQAYPRNVAPAFYTSPVISGDGSKVTVPASFVNSSKLVSVDVKLQTPVNTLDYQGRAIPLAYYKDGEYLPLILLSTPSGKTVAGIRTCEPCGSFSFHIVPGEILQCDTCGTQWKVEDFAPVTGGCLPYPPPKLDATIDFDVEVDLSPLRLNVAT